MKHFLFILLVVLIACKATQTEEPTNNVDKIENTGPKIVFLFFEASKNTDDSIQIALLEQQLVKGKLKGFFPKEIPSSKYEEGNVLVTILSNDNDTVQLQIANPLDEEVEFINEEDQLEKKTIHHEKKEFVVRIPFHNPINSIKFEQLTKINQELTPTLINQINLQ